MSIIKKIKEDKLRVARIKIGFRGVVPNGLNYTDSHNPMQPFGTRWGRGLLYTENGNIDSLITSYGGQHSDLKKALQGKGNTIGTYYWGYDLATKTVYLEYASDSSFNFNSSKYLMAIMEALRYSRGPMKDFVLI